ncbi:MAG: hypothetical protein KKH61_20155 [Gammaproteobacteria bacterium]|nr:hypothetical protein [Gammaproteobacteria bacterium]
MPEIYDQHGNLVRPWEGKEETEGGNEGFRREVESMYQPMVVEEPPTVEGEYTEVPSEKEVGTDRSSFWAKIKGFGKSEAETPEAQAARRAYEEEEKGKKKEFKLREAELEAKRLQRRILESEAEQRLRTSGGTWPQKFGRGYGQAKKVGTEAAKFGKTVQRLGTLGGVPSVSTASDRREFYFGKAKGSIYTPPAPSYEPLTGMRQLTAPGDAQGTGMMRQVTTPRLGRLKQATSPTSLGDSRLAQMVAPTERLAQGPVGFGRPGAEGAPLSELRRLTAPSGLGLERLRQIMMPHGLTPIEKQAYIEIRQNHDIDTPSHVMEELEKLGVPREESNQAIKGLLQKNIVRKDKMFGDEPVLEVVR